MEARPELKLERGTAQHGPATWIDRLCICLYKLITSQCTSIGIRWRAMADQPEQPMPPSPTSQPNGAEGEAIEGRVTPGIDLDDERLSFGRWSSLLSPTPSQRQQQNFRATLPRPAGERSPCHTAAQTCCCMMQSVQTLVASFSTWHLGAAVAIPPLPPCSTLHISPLFSPPALTAPACCPCRIAHAMSEYAADGEWEIARWEHNYSLLPPEHRALLPGLPAKYGRPPLWPWAPPFWVWLAAHAMRLQSHFRRELPGAP